MSETLKEELSLLTDGKQFFLALCQYTQMYHNMSELVVLRLRAQLAKKSLGMKKLPLKIDLCKWPFPTTYDRNNFSFAAQKCMSSVSKTASVRNPILV